MYTEEDKDTSLVDNTTELEKHKSFDLVHTSKAQEAKKEVQTVSSSFMIIKQNHLSYFL